MSTLRKVLFKTLGAKKYLEYISRVYIRRIEKGKYKEKYPELHFLKQFIRPDFYCVDIGANLGYYSYFLAKYAHQGKVWGVEPVPLFANVLKKNCSFSNFIHVPYALGAENMHITMHTPVVNGVFRHGLTKVDTSNTQVQDPRYTYHVEMKTPDELFQNLPRLDFVKCDIEGYEYVVFQNFIQTIKKHLPILQIEIQSQSREKMYALLNPIGYIPHKLEQEKWTLLLFQDYLTYAQDIYFLPNQ